MPCRLQIALCLFAGLGLLNFCTTAAPAPLSPSQVDADLVGETASGGADADRSATDVAQAADVAADTATAAPSEVVVADIHETAGATTEVAPSPDADTANVIAKDVANEIVGCADTCADSSQPDDASIEAADATPAAKADVEPTPCQCGNGSCESTCSESLATCPIDCAVCGDKVCTVGEGPAKCPEDCCGGCGDGKCKGYACGENTKTCPADCGTACGDKVCDPGESPLVCPVDCKWQACGNGVCESTDGGPSKCPVDCSSACGDCVCQKGEDSLACPVDCGYCGDGVCSPCALASESTASCAADCGVAECLPGQPTSCDDENPCTTDDCTPGGSCTHSPQTAACSDANPCTTGDLCWSGACLPGAWTSCDDGNVCTADACAKTTGCANNPLQQPCSDGNACTVNDMCTQGICAPGAALECDLGTACAPGFCDPVKSCANQLLTGTSCDDANACTFGDMCTKGVCKGALDPCNDNEICTFDSCVAPKGCQHAPDSTVCDDGNECTLDVCTVAKGCSHPLAEDDTPCTAACIPGQCVQGTCKPTGKASCDDANVCTVDTCTSQGCGHTPVAQGTDCSTACAIGACALAVCVTSTVTNCTDGDPCTLDLCAPSTGCAHMPALWDKLYGGKNAAVDASYATAAAAAPGGAVAVLAMRQGAPWLQVIDAAGNAVVDRTYEFGTYPQPSGIVASPEGGWVVAYSAALGVGTKLVSTATYLRHIKPSGTPKWVATWEEPGKNVYSPRLTSVAGGGYVLAATRATKAYNDGDFAVRHFGATGNVLWSTVAGGGFDEQVAGVVQTTDGGFAAVANMSNSQTTIGRALRVTKGGAVLWLKSLGLGWSTQISTITALPEGSLLLTGVVVLAYGQPAKRMWVTLGAAGEVLSSVLLDPVPGKNAYWQQLQLLADGTLLGCGVVQEVASNAQGSYAPKPWVTHVAADGKLLWQVSYGTGTHQTLVACPMLTDGAIAAVGSRQVVKTGGTTTEANVQVHRLDGWGNSLCADSAGCVSKPAGACDDKNACTVDGCGLGVCSHSAAPIGMACGKGLVCGANGCAAP